MLKEYLYRGYAIYQRMNQVENQVAKLTNQVQTMVQKDLGKKLFCFTMIESADVVEVVRRLGTG